MRDSNPTSWTTPEEAAEYALKRWGHAHYLSGRDSYRRDPRDDTWREFAAWIRKTGDPGADAAAAAIEHFPGLIIDFPVRLDNPGPPGLGPMLGEPENLLNHFSAGHRRAILDYLEQPTEDGWDRIHGMFLTPGVTVSEWVDHVDPACPEGIPKAASVILAIRVAANVAALRKQLMP